MRIYQKLLQLLVWKVKIQKDPDLRLTHKNKDTEKKSTSAPESEESHGNEAHTQFPAATNDIEHEEKPGADFETDSEKINRLRENSLRKRRQALSFIFFGI